ncbi:MAG: hypothetical protein F6K40_04775 [Okeania sp. SIO3I5]|uniref:hypothetical protein n=1 Tax=Okeania sp. SIO3I5 TaxID=2607805 RepID=UPI0013BD49D0|nr:hypothetical protein [Okeania sp. SIO3I5]NEQ35647.1 hypothetical protein [Okeania sp. SIO3I5]
MPFQNEFTLLTCYGLHIYEPDERKFTELYKQFFKALMSGGILVTSFTTKSPDVNPNSE